MSRRGLHPRLTVRNGHGARGLPIPLGLLGMIALIAVVEVGLVLRNDLQLTERIPHRWRYAGQAATGPDALGSDVLCLGDSQILLGLVPSLIEERSGLSAFNLAVPGGQAPSTYWIYRRALETGARPKVLIVGFFPGLLSINGVMNLRNWPELLGPRELIDLAATAKSPPLFLRSAMGRLLPTIRKRDDIRMRILDTWNGLPNRMHEVVMAHRRNWAVNRGAQVAPAEDTFVDELDESLADANRGRSWRPDPTNAAYIDRLLRLAARHGTTVAWVMPTISPTLQKHRDGNGLDRDYERFARSLLARHDNLVIIDGRRSGYDATAFRDAVHLERRGAVALSSDIGDLLRELVGSEPAVAPLLLKAGVEDRWVGLPQYSVPSLHRDLEDIEQSRRALARFTQGTQRR